ncbi:MAG: murein L,D-transpeptidase [Hyphomonadaceae bacterium]|jgi:murein L,D-transpeptidase YafK|nr:murein L,D-transpeptidase [Hyphomonadaceae bacterium]
MAAAAMSSLLISCAKIELAPHLRPLTNDTMMLLGKKGMHAQAPIFIRIYKEESELEVWKLRDDGRYYHFKTYPICTWSGGLGPKLREGDRQAPEGFYTITREQMNPDSQFHLAFNLGFPNAYDKALRRTGDALMVHGRCSSAGCYAMTDALIEEIYALAREAFVGGQDSFQVHAYPFRMTDANMARHAKSEWHAFWRTLKEGHDYFELTRQVPTIAICNRRYVVNVGMSAADAVKLNAEAACPAFHRPQPTPFSPKPGEQIAQSHVIVPGVKKRTAASIETDAPRSGLTKAAETGPAWWNRMLSSFGRPSPK